MQYALGEISPKVDSSAWIAPNASVIGHSQLSARSSIWFGAVLRGDNERIFIGECSNVQENSVLHTDPGFPLTIGAYCTIGHKAMLHGCEIGEGSLIGMSATVLNGAMIGKGCLIGAGALVPEGTIIPDRSLVLGIPGKVKRTLDGDDVRKLKDSALYYAQNARRFAQDLRLVQSTQ